MARNKRKTRDRNSVLEKERMCNVGLLVNFTSFAINNDSDNFLTVSRSNKKSYNTEHMAFASNKFDY